MALSSSVVFLLSLLLPATPTSSQCIGMPCQYKGECRSKLGECGTTTAHCDAESQWVAACGGGSELVRPVVIDTTANNNNQQSTTFHPMDTNRDGYIEQAEIDAASTNTLPQQQQQQQHQQQQQQQQTQNMQTTSSGAMDASQQVVTTTTTTATIPPSAMTQTSLGQEGAVSVEEDNAAAAAAADQAKIKEAIDQELNEASAALSPTSIESGQQAQLQQQQTPTISPITLWEEWSNQQSGGSTGSTSNTDSSSSGSSSTIYQHPNTNETEGWGDLNAWDNGRTEKEDGGVFDMMEDYVFGEDDTSSSSSLSTFGSGTMSIEGRIMTTLVLFKSMLLLLGY